LQQIGLEAERLEMFNMSAAMASQFVTAAQQMADRVQALGPSPLRAASATEGPPREEDGSEE
jgi:F420-non-reducing hydrogenase iron-sulfur subunit